MKKVLVAAAFIFCIAGISKAQVVNSTTSEQKIEKASSEVVTGTDAKTEDKSKKCEGKKKCCKKGKKCTKEEEAACHKKKSAYNDKDRRRSKELV